MYSISCSAKHWRICSQVCFPIALQQNLGLQSLPFSQAHRLLANSALLYIIEMGNNYKALLAKKKILSTDWFLTKSGMCTHVCACACVHVRIRQCARMYHVCCFLQHLLHGHHFYPHFLGGHHLVHSWIHRGWNPGLRKLLRDAESSETKKPRFLLCMARAEP